MRPKKQPETPDLFRSRLDQILDSKHPLFKLSNQIDWSFFKKESVNPSVSWWLFIISNTPLI